MRKYNVLQKVMALALALFMVLGLLPTIALSSDAAALTVSGKVADPETLNNWQTYYGYNSVLPDGSTGISTWKAGGVWTDKSVFATDEAIEDADLPTSLKDQDAFLVALSALASNKEIVGQSSAPSDTMLVLDLSQSMDNSGSVPTMIAAANETIDTLLKMNDNNRVGVVLYSGRSTTGNSDKNTATVILPLDHYTTTSVSGGKPQYLSVNGNSDTTVSVANGTRNSSNRRPTGSKNTVGGTYIQNGLYQAYEEFVGMADKGVVQSGTQKGFQRTPIMVLMSDGAPTIATTNYHNVGTSNTGDGSSTTDKITFLTQLTAAWTKGKIGAYYNNAEAKFYTLGLGTANNAQATAVLYPAGSNNTLTGYWNNFNSGSTDGNNVSIGSGSGRFTVQYQSAAEQVGRNYVDMYTSARNASELIAAFKEIVEEIGLQSAYSATLVASGNADLDGYITVEDELGAMMQVKDIKGILLGRTLFTGAELARSLNEGSLGTTTNPTAYGDEFVRTVKERLGIADTSVAQALIAAAYADGQLSYTSGSVYSNYIGWYGDENNNYLGFWDKDTGMTAVGAPAGAKYINKSYGYLGDTDHGGEASDMMHIVVMVHTEIATGHQTVLFKIPSALIPMITYKVDMEGDALETAENITLTVAETDPIRLLYEVGLPDDINEVNLEQKIAEYLAKDGSNHIHENADGSYTFYANSWDNNHDGVAPDISELTDGEKQALTASVAESHFIPNTANERFYVLEDSVVYTRSGSSYTALKSLPVSGGEYYFARTIVNVVGAGGAAEAVTQYEILSNATVADSGNFAINADGNCIVKAGTIRQTLSHLELAKSSNDTDTIGYSDSLWVYVPGDDAEDYNVYSFLGNNGKLTVMPATGIKVTKAVTELADGAAADEAFPIIVTIDAEVAAPAVTDANGNALTGYTAEVTGGKTVVTVKLADGESAYITGLPAGVTYTVTEAANDNYTYTYAGATATVASTIVEGVVTNEPVKPGNLYITKEVVHANGGEVFPTDHEFEFEVAFVENGAPIANTTFQLENNYDASITELTTDANGIMRGKLMHGETVFIKNIPAGTVVTVTEVNIPANYTSTVYRSRNASGQDADDDGVVTIVSEANATVVVTNTYTPDKVGVDISFAGTKNFDATHMAADSEFTFKLQEYVNGGWAEVEGEVVTITGGTNASENFAFDVLDLEFAEPGVYSYRIIEELGANTDITYDRSVYAFSVNVTIDSNGDLQAEVVGYNQMEDIFEVTGDVTNGYTVTTVFTNQYHTTATSVKIEKAIDDKGNSGKTAAGFVIETYEATVDADGVWTLGDFIRSTVTDAQGQALLVRNYDNTDFELNDADGDRVVTYHFIIKEKAAGEAGWTYDATEYHLTVVLTKDDAGVITADFDVVKVDAQGNKTDLEVGGDTATITFKNTYDPQTAEVDLDVIPTVVKELKGRDVVANEFTFAIFENGASSFTDTTNAIMVGTNDADGNVAFTAAAYGIEKGLVNAEKNTLSFGKVGKYELDIVEIHNGVSGVSYDSTIYDLVVEVTDAGDGTLQAVYYFEDSVSEQVAFRNTYTTTPTEVIIEGLKTLQVNSGVKPLTAGMFTFGLYANDVKIAETTNLANGSFVFDAIAYTLDDAGKTFTYTVREIAPDGTTDGSYSANGLRYSGQSFAVTVAIADNGDGTLSAVVTGNGADSIHFINTYESVPAYVRLTATKTLEGRDLTAGEFQFVLYRSDKDFLERATIVKQSGQDYVTNDAAGNLAVSVGGLDLGYHYFVLKEVIPEERAAGIQYDAGEYHITVQVTDSGNGQMSAVTTVYHPGDPNAQNPAIAFRNTYRPDDTSVIISGNKILTGGKSLEADVFGFELYEGTALLDTALAAADGTFSFDTITYTADDIGSHTYVVKEAIPAGANAENGWTLGNITYDVTEYTVVVTVSDTDKDGKLEVSKTVNGDASKAIAFTNVHTPDPITHQLEAKKIYEKGLKGEDFSFTLEGEGFDKQTKKNDADGKILFDPLVFTEAGTYTFTVKEKKDGILSFIRPSEAEYEVTVTVINDNGVLRVTGTNVVNTKNTGEGNLEFVNTYLLEGEDDVVLSGTKTVTGDRTTITAGQFSFGLYDAEGKLVESVKNDTNGKFTFSALIFDQDDVAMNGQSQFVYTVKEIAGDNARYTYDTTVYTVTVTVKDNDEGGVDASYVITSEGKAAELAFTNTYTNPAPVTYAPIAKKTYNKDLAGGEFEFTLEGEGFAKQTKTNDADGNVVFDALSFPEAGTYTFTVKELAKVLGFINYSKAEHTIVVKVIDTKGVLSIESVTINGDAEGTIEFVNTYVMDGEGEVTLTGTKTLTGDRTTITAGQFSFGLYDAEGKLVESVKNDAAGKFAFNTLTFDESDVAIDGESTYVYTVKEIPGAADVGITYDKTVYTVTVTVKDNDEGGVTVSHTITADGKAAELAFTNTYTVSGTAKLELTGTKELTGGKPLSDGAYTFGLYEGGQLITSAKNTGSSFTLTKEFTAKELGSYTYTVAEILPEGAVQNEDGTWTLDSITYDPAVYTVKVVVADNGKGGIELTSELVDAEAIAFRNVYTPDPVVITVNVDKVLDNKTDKTVSLEGFQFQIALDKNTYTATSDATGKTGFTVTFDESDIGKTYTFQVTEKNTGIKGMTYDKTVHTFAVQVLQNADGTLKTVIDGQEAASVALQFTNVYEELVTPPTGDNFNLILPIVLMVLSLLGVAVVLITRKRRAA